MVVGPHLVSDDAPQYLTAYLSPVASHRLGWSSVQQQRGKELTDTAGEIPVWRAWFPFPFPFSLPFSWHPSVFARPLTLNLIEWR